MADDAGMSLDDEDLPDAVAREERVLHDAPSVAQDGPRMRRDSDAGPSAETRLTGWEILEAEELGPRLRNLHAAAQPEK